VVETTDPGEDDPHDDEDEKRGTDVVHDGLEMSLVLSTHDEHGSATDEGTLGRSSSESVSLSTLATGSVVESVTDVLVGSERLSSDSRLIGSDDGVTNVLLTHVIVIVFLVVLMSVVGVFVTKLLPVFETIRVFVVADKRGIGGNDFTFLNDDLW
jgi:hypothetical protein